MAIPSVVTDITDPQGITTLAAALGESPDFAVDLEADAMHHFHSRLCFVQIATDSKVSLIDTLVPQVSLTALTQAFADEKKPKFFHAAGGDLQFLAEIGIRVRGLFDTHRAATLLAWPKVGLADVVREKVGVTLSKEHQHSDFSLRPLPEAMRQYIADDVRYLVDVARMVRQACVDADILEEVQLDCDRLCDEAAERPDVSKDYNIKIPRNGLSNEAIAFARVAAMELHTMRLRLAEAADVPMGRMLSNAAIGAIATRVPQTVKELSRLEGVRGAFAREHGAEVFEMFSRLTRLKAAGQLPALPDKKEKDSRRKKREDVLGEWRKEVAPKRKVAPSVVLPNALIEDIAEQAPTNLEQLSQLKYLGEKRVKLYGTDIVRIVKAHL